MTILDRSSPPDNNASLKGFCIRDRCSSEARVHATLAQCFQIHRTPIHCCFRFKRRRFAYIRPRLKIRLGLARLSADYTEVYAV